MLKNEEEREAMKKKNKSILNKEINIVFVYLFIFLFGIVVVLGMTSYINNKVQEFNEELVSSQN